MLQSLVVYSMLLGVGFWIYKILKMRNLPPGPFGLPVVGYLPFLGTKNVHLKLQQLGFKYGPIFSVQLGPKLFVVLTDATAVREMFSKAELNSRLLLPFNELIGLANPYFENGEPWHQHRKFLMQVFRKLGVGKTSIQDLIRGEVQSFLQVVSHLQAAPIDIREPLSFSILNFNSYFLLGKKLSTTDQVLLNESMDQGFTYFQEMVKFSFFPWIFHIPVFRRMNQRLIKNIQGLNKTFTDILKKEINEEASASEISNGPNFAKCYLTEMKIQKNNSESTFDDESLFGSIVNLYGASTSSTVATLEWCLYAVAALHQCQLKIHEEIDRVIGKEGIPTFAHLKSMPLMHSFLLEVQRHYTIVPITWPRTVSEELNTMGYTIPKGTDVTVCLYALHHDKDYFEKPEEFIPERFIIPNTESVKKSESYMPFSFGKRNCPGENLANMEIFYYFANILQKFEIKVPDGKRLDFDGVMNATYQPKNQKLCFLPRT